MLVSSEVSASKDDLCACTPAKYGLQAVTFTLLTLLAYRIVFARVRPRVSQSCTNGQQATLKGQAVHQLDTAAPAVGTKVAAAHTLQRSGSCFCHQQGLAAMYSRMLYQHMSYSSHDRPAVAG